MVKLKNRENKEDRIDIEILKKIKNRTGWIQLTNEKKLFFSCNDFTYLKRKEKTIGIKFKMELGEYTISVWLNGTIYVQGTGLYRNEVANSVSKLIKELKRGKNE